MAIHVSSNAALHLCALTKICTILLGSAHAARTHDKEVAETHGRMDALLGEVAELHSENAAQRESIARLQSAVGSENIATNLDALVHSGFYQCNPVVIGTPHNRSAWDIILAGTGTGSHGWPRRKLLFRSEKEKLVFGWKSIDREGVSEFTKALEANCAQTTLELPNRLLTNSIFCTTTLATGVLLCSRWHL